ncbi:hypothetical protein Trydic_g6671 [Trypoxylus dichotomus]
MQPLLYKPNKQESKCQKRRTQTSGTSKTDNLSFSATRTDDWIQDRLRKNNNDKHEQTSSDKEEKSQQAGRRATSTTGLENYFKVYPNRLQKTTQDRQNIDNGAQPSRAAGIPCLSAAATRLYKVYDEAGSVCSSPITTERERPEEDE